MTTINSLDLQATTKELLNERQLAIQIAEANLHKAQIELEKVIAYYNQILI